MDTLITYALIGLAMAAYAGATASYLVLFLRRGEWAVWGARPLLLLGMAFHLALLLTIWITWHHFPLTQPGEALMTVTLLFFVAYVIVELRLGQQGLGVFILSVGLVVFTIGAVQIRRHDAIPELLANGRFIVHVVFSITGYSFLLIAAIASGLFLLLRHEIRAKRLGALYRRLPPLEMLDRMGFHATLLGMGMLTVGIILGLIAVPHERGAAVYADPKLIATGIVWLFNAVYLYGRSFRGWQRRKAAWISVAAFGALLISISVVPLLPGVFHEFR